VHGLEVFAARAVADAEAPRLEVGRVRGRRELAVALLVREPSFAVVLLRSRRAEVAGRDVHDPVRDLEPLQDLLLDREQSLVLVDRRTRLAVDEHLDLVELMDAEHAAVSLPAAPASRRKFVE